MLSTTKCQDLCDSSKWSMLHVSPTAVATCGTHLAISEGVHRSMVSRSHPGSAKPLVRHQKAESSIRQNDTGLQPSTQTLLGSGLLGQGTQNAYCQLKDLEDARATNLPH